jgi:hypothetical protein
LDKAITPGTHQDPWVNLLGDYVTEAVAALRSNGMQIQRSWLDPTDPRDATIVLAGTRALVFDEVTGWRHGRFVAGLQGVRTQLAEVSYLGGGVLPGADELAHRVINGFSVPRREYRSVADLHDGLDDALRARLS